ncbi:LHFPL tetraspan subfamily member 2a protein-like isoform X1 [Haliotis rubra]|uniref:LHFPL tetraspan subfamily member 2a protein-like isoform X1 n=1 Tax=Haliotis rufescens TaxID=6454 RepID=UPI001EAFAF37|nr:LHFPL tetraspan subfamily member 2a protein-like isoform X1 [Haliotis rufescens]XP_046356017.1 LHFPL tetraspan subfamily member 2a protein-like isoform X1 [Haliotis rufescens]XP_046356019.1 LHFPL tetraspan subfamily member 2a protein-like isoform X1 [Haliotis rufescens]XP_046557489.1 LHFPL tetraspan subfamily member 2a protein-like isoform X1 [Haliotis rubra]XP_046557501.1 LHFPL tetraspan subfamily member 2a protein-like isoform X1 [Haliotis rubra]XP_046557507.1 LHFPL tetraspan subfamily me
MVSPILVLWTVLSVLVAGACTFTFLQPFWILHLDFSHSFGMVTHCFMDSRYENDRDVCTAYGGYYHLGNIPSGAWQAACVLYGTGCVLMCLSAFLALCNTSMVKENTRRVALVSGYMQAIAVLIMIAGLLIFPLGFGSSYFRHYCGDTASAYDSGHCLIGWSYMLGIMGTALSMFCPFLSQFTDMKTSDIFS